MFELAIVNEPSVFESLKFYSIIFDTEILYGYATSDMGLNCLSISLFWDAWHK